MPRPDAGTAPAWRGASAAALLDRGREKPDGAVVALPISARAKAPASPARGREGGNVLHVPRTRVRKCRTHRARARWRNIAKDVPDSIVATLANARMAPGPRFQWRSNLESRVRLADLGHRFGIGAERQPSQCFLGSLIVVFPPPRLDHLPGAHRVGKPVLA